MADLEHPDITRALRTGYPREPADFCQRCGSMAEYADEYGYSFCYECAMRIAEQRRVAAVERLENMGWSALIEWAGFEEA